MPPQQKKVKKAILMAAEMEYKCIGRVLFKPTSMKKIGLGAVGYFDDDGNWEYLFNLNELSPKGPRPAGNAAKYSRLESPLPEVNDSSEHGKMEWDDVRSEHTRKVSLGLAVNGPAPTAVKIDLGVKGRYTLDTAFGAVVAIRGEANHLSFPWPSMINRWVDRNMDKVCREWSDVGVFGLWIISDVHTAKKVEVKTWTNRDDEINLGLDVCVDGIVKVNPEFDYKTGHKSEEAGVIYEAHSGEDLVWAVGGKIFEHHHFFLPGRRTIGKPSRSVPEIISNYRRRDRAHGFDGPDEKLDEKPDEALVAYNIGSTVPDAILQQPQGQRAEPKWFQPTTIELARKFGAHLTRK